MSLQLSNDVRCTPSLPPCQPTGWFPLRDFDALIGRPSNHSSSTNSLHLLYTSRSRWALQGQFEGNPVQIHRQNPSADMNNAKQNGCLFKHSFCSYCVFWWSRLLMLVLFLNDLHVICQIPLRLTVAPWFSLGDVWKCTGGCLSVWNNRTSWFRNTFVRMPPCQHCTVHSTSGLCNHLAWL